MPTPNAYIILERIRPGLIGTTHYQYGKQFWAIAKMTKKHLGDACLMCGSPVGAQAFRPLTNKSNRMMRMCTKHENDAPK